MNTNKFNVTAASGNTTVAGTLGVTSDLTVNTNKFIVTALTGNTTVGGTLSVLGATITGPTSGTFSIDGGFAGGALNIGGTANTGTVTIGRATQTVAHPGNVTVAGTIAGSGNISTSAGGITITGNSTIAGTLTSLTGLTSSGTITFSGLTTGLVYNTSGVLSQVGNGTAGQVLTSNGASAPTFQAVAGTASNVVVLASGTTTYTPSAGTLAIMIECVGGGGAGGGASGGSGTASVGGGGGAGSYQLGYLASPVGPYTIQIGAGGVGGSGTSGGNGTATWFGSASGQCVANFGTGGLGPLVAGTTVSSNLGGPGGAAATCNSGCKLTVAGAAGDPGVRFSGTLVNPGNGANSEFAGGGQILSQGQTAGAAGGVGCLR